MTGKERVWRAVRRGKVTTKEIQRAARVPLEHVHPLLGRLREEGRVRGRVKDGTLRAIGEPDPWARALRRRAA